MKRIYPQNKCCICGKFVKYDADNSTPFGGYNDYEPPEPEFYCESCTEKEYEYHKKHGHVPSAWIPAKWHLKLAKELGFVQASPIGCAWFHWSKPDNIPEDWAEWKPY